MSSTLSDVAAGALRPPLTVDDAVRPRRLGYLSGAPRVSTDEATDGAGPRAHVLGVIGGFEARGWTVRRYIVGDRMPAKVATEGEHFVRGGRVRTLIADLARLALRIKSDRGAWGELGTQVDLVYERFALFQALGSRFAQHGVPWVLETNALLADEAYHERQSVVLYRTARRMERLAYHACDMLVAVSDTLADRLVLDMDVPRDKIVVIPNGVDTSAFDPARDAVTRGNAPFTIVFVGSLVPWQGLEGLLRAVHAVRTTEGCPVNLVIAGDGPERGALTTLAQSLGISDVVRFVGRIAPSLIPNVIAGADIGYCGHTGADAETDAFRSPLKLYEYMAMGRPVIASAVPDVRAVVTDSVHGFLFAPGDLLGLRRAIIEAYRSRDRIDAMGAAARQTVLVHHSWAARVDDILAAATARIGLRP